MSTLLSDEFRLAARRVPGNPSTRVSPRNTRTGTQDGQFWLRRNAFKGEPPISSDLCEKSGLDTNLRAVGPPFAQISLRFNALVEAPTALLRRAIKQNVETST